MITRMRRRVSRSVKMIGRTCMCILILTIIFQLLLVWLPQLLVLPASVWLTVLFLVFWKSLLFLFHLYSNIKDLRISVNLEWILKSNWSTTSCTWCKSQINQNFFIIIFIFLQLIFQEIMFCNFYMSGHLKNVLADKLVHLFLVFSFVGF